MKSWQGRPQLPGVKSSSRKSRCFAHVKCELGKEGSVLEALWRSRNETVKSDSSSYQSRCSFYFLHDSFNELKHVITEKQFPPFFFSFLHFPFSDLVSFQCFAGIQNFSCLMLTSLELDIFCHLINPYFSFSFLGSLTSYFPLGSQVRITPSWFNCKINLCIPSLDVKILSAVLNYSIIFTIPA